MNVLEHGFDLKHDQQCRVSTSHFYPCVSSLLCSHPLRALLMEPLFLTLSLRLSGHVVFTRVCPR